MLHHFANRQSRRILCWPMQFQWILCKKLSILQNRIGINRLTHISNADQWIVGRFLCWMLLHVSSFYNNEISMIYISKLNNVVLFFCQGAQTKKKRIKRNSGYSQRHVSSRHVSLYVERYEIIAMNLYTTQPTISLLWFAIRFSDRPKGVSLNRNLRRKISFRAISRKIFKQKVRIYSIELNCLPNNRKNELKMLLRYEYEWIHQNFK